MIYQMKNTENHIDLYCGDQNLYTDFVVTYDYSIHKPLQWKIKRFIDVSHSLAFIVILSPLFIVIPTIIRIKSKGPAIFKQTRIGMHGKLFTMYKFRTMYENSDERKVKDDSDQRITGFGRFLRKYSLDEIPQLFNILKGDMSLIGPRPIRECIFNQIQAVEPEYALRFAIKPGLRLDAGRLNGGACPEMAKHEKTYIKNWSLINDLKIFLHIMSDTVKGKNY